jgi:hypothetical protein
MPACAAVTSSVQPRLSITVQRASAVGGTPTEPRLTCFDCEPCERHATAAVVLRLR